MLIVTMHTTNQILDAISAKAGGVTDYRLSKMFGTSTSAVGNWRAGRTALSLDYALKAAALLEWEAAYVVACVERERAEKDQRLEATDEIKATWEKIAQAFRPAAAILAVVFLLAALAPQVVSGANGTSSRVQFIHYAQWRRRRAHKWEWFASVLEFLQETFGFRDALHFGRVMPVQLTAELSP
jgi:hypothetical protein